MELEGQLRASRRAETGCMTRRVVKRAIGHTQDKAVERYGAKVPFSLLCFSASLLCIALKGQK